MGIVDSNSFTLSCAECGVKEDVAVHQKGSSFGTSWQVGPELNHFDVQWNSEGLTGPVIEKAICKKCGKSPVVKS